MAERTRTDSRGVFDIRLDPHGSNEEPIAVSLTVTEGEGVKVLESQRAENTTGRIDFEVKLDLPQGTDEASDIYAGGFERLVSEYDSMRDSGRLSASGLESLDHLVGVVRGWSAQRDELARTCGLEVRQVPRYGRAEAHQHLVRWDEVDLPK